MDLKWNVVGHQRKIKSHVKLSVENESVVSDKKVNKLLFLQEHRENKASPLQSCFFFLLCLTKEHGLKTFGT